MFVCKDADPSTSARMTMSPGGMRNRPGKAKRPDRSGALCFLQCCLLVAKEERRHGNVRPTGACFNARGVDARMAGTYARMAGTYALMASTERNLALPLIMWS